MGGVGLKMTGVVGVLACGLSPVESPPFSIRKEGKWVARSRKAPTRSKVPKPQIPTRLLPSPLQDAFLGGSCPLLRFYLHLRFLLLLSLRCHYPAASNRHSNPHLPLLQESFPACAPLTSQNILHHELDATRPFSGFSARFLTKTPMCDAPVPP